MWRHNSETNFMSRQVALAWGKMPGGRTVARCWHRGQYPCTAGYTNITVTAGPKAKSRTACGFSRRMVMARPQSGHFTE
jgi:hypothetical protein